MAIAIGSAINLVLTLLWAARWKLGLSALGIRAPYSKVLVAIVSSFPIGNFLPAGKAAQEAFRMAYLDIDYSRRSAVMAATMMEWGMESLVIFALIMVVVIRHFFAAGALAAAVMYGVQPPALSDRLRGFVADLADSLRQLARRPKVMLSYAAISASIIVLDMFKVWVLALYSEVALALLDLITVYVVMRVASISPMPAGLGFLDLGLLATLKIMGYGVTSILVFIALLRVVDTVIPSLVGLGVLVSSGTFRVLRQARHGVAGRWRL